MTQFGFFDSSEFACADGSHSVWFHKHGVDVNPQLVDLCNKIRSKYGRPVVVTSGYRSESHNAKVGGVANSLHCQGQAADIKPLAKDMKYFAEFAKACYDSNPNGGVGIYDSWMHVDIRGYAARWDERSGND